MNETCLLENIKKIKNLYFNIKFSIFMLFILITRNIKNKIIAFKVLDFFFKKSKFIYDKIKSNNENNN